VRVAVLGSGVVGVASAWYLARAGHEVTVYDRQVEPGLETSFANAGQVSPGYSAPWAGPGVPIKAIRWLMMRHRPFVLLPGTDPALYRWLALMLRECTEAAYHTNKARMVRLAEYSRDCLDDLRHETGIEYDGRQQGTLQLFRTQKQLDHVHDDTRVLDAGGVAYEVLDEAGCVAAEPALALVPGRVLGGLRLPHDETGDAFKFTQALAAMARGLGVAFRHGVEVRALEHEAGRITAMRLAPADAVPSAGGAVSGLPRRTRDDDGTGERVEADRYVVALGSYSPFLLRALGIDAPIYPVKGYSLTLPVTDPGAAPVSTVMDETYKVGITRLGERIRVGGTAELAGFSRKLRAPRRATLEHSLRDLFPQGGDLSQAEFWTGLRPMTPDGTPIVGATRYENLFTNTGHGTLGWTMACGSGRLLADLVSERRPNIEHEDLAVGRYG
jgi:D-amino-acid dehydrogenase